MAEKSVDDQIAEHNEEIRKLEAKKEELRVKALPQYPKHIQVPREEAEEFTPTTTIVVNSAEEEKAALAGKHKGQAVPESADQKRQIDEIRAKEAEDKKYYGKGHDDSSTRASRATARHK